MGPLWCRQGTVPHTTLNDLLSTDVLVTLTGASVGAGEETINYVRIHTGVLVYIPANIVLVVAVTELLVLLPNTAVTLKRHWLPGSAENM